MPTPNLQLVQPGNDTLIGVWDVPVNGNSAIIDNALGALATLNAAGASGNVALTLAQYQCANIIVTGTPGGALTYQLPAGVGRFLFVANSTPQTVGFGSASGSAVASIPAGYAATVVIDPTNGARLANTVTATAGGVTGNVQFNSGGGLGGAAGLNYNATTQGVTVGGPLGVAGNLTIGGNVTSPLIVQGGSATTLTRTLTFAASAMLVDCSLGNVFTVILTSSVTGAPSFANQQDGQTVNVRLQQDASGTRTMTWPSNFRWPGGTPGVLSTAAGAVDLLVATYFSVSGTWLANLIKGFA